jgi:hypothetical protein
MRDSNVLLLGTIFLFIGRCGLILVWENLDSNRD